MREAMAIIVGISEELVTSYLKCLGQFSCSPSSPFCKSAPVLHLSVVRVRDEFKHRREELQQARVGMN